MTPRKKPFESIVGKGENAGNLHFLLFPQCLLPCQTEIIIWLTLILLPANGLNLIMSKIGEELTLSSIYRYTRFITL